MFDIAGNHFRIITVIHYNRQKLYIREVFTHTEYDLWTKAQRSRNTYPQSPSTPRPSPLRGTPFNARCRCAWLRFTPRLNTIELLSS